jgi:RNA-directed DNA polymerase
MNEETQMTTIAISAGASSTLTSKTWDNLSWDKINKQVIRLQIRIAKAEREGKKGRVKALQRILTSSFYAKCLAVKRVVLNKGGKTPGVDGIIWRTSRQKIQAVLSLKRRGYNPLPSKRIYVPKKQKGKLRPISIPTMKDKAMQALWLMALIPIAEQRADPNSYGFRPKRSTQDAREQCFNILSRTGSARWIFEGDIYSCFDKISHQWLLENIPMDKQILRKFLKAGFMEKQRLYHTELGTEQGSIISPTLALMALSGIEGRIRSSRKRARDKEKINFISYADDFVITGDSPELLEEKVIPIVIEFLKEVGLELSKEKSRITCIDDGFNFLGFNVRKYRGILLIKPSKENIKEFLTMIRSTIKANYPAKTENLINLLNPKIRGWANYFRGSVSSQTFSEIDDKIYKMLKSWMLRRHPNKRKSWITKKYFIRRGLSNWNFHAMIKDKKGNNTPLYLYRASGTPINRHIKIMSDANPYDPKFKEYFKHRESTSKTRISSPRLELSTRLLGGNAALLRA